MKIRGVFIVAILLIVLGLIFFSMFYNEGNSSISGKASSATGKVTFAIQGGFDINITSPKNKTYYFDHYHENNSYELPLNVTSEKDVVSWRYKLEDLKHDEVVNESVEFFPNTSFGAVRWQNKLTVFANDSSGSTAEDDVYFFVHVPNSAPVIENISKNIYVCENDYVSSKFNVTDVDEDDIESDISPKDPFYVYPSTRELDGKTASFEIFSGELEKEDVGGYGSGYKIYEERVSVTDNHNSSCCADSEEVNITTIEVNNEPSIEDLGANTVYTRGANSTFYEEVEVSDIEDGGRTSENMSFSLNFSGDERLFNISEDGVINFSADENTSTGVYNVSVCVRDSGIPNPYSNITEECGQTGEPIKKCDNFSVTVTDDNRPPTIVEHYPENLTMNVSGTENLYFNITNYDPDGTIPDVFWYVDDELKERENEKKNDSFRHEFGCGVSGEHSVKAEISDGLLNDSVEWKLNVDYVECPSPPSGGGGGGGSGEVCEEKWVCKDWSVCQNAEESLKRGSLAREKYRKIKDYCDEMSWLLDNCGYQMRSCEDMNNCSTTSNKPDIVRPCFYTEDPSCKDGIKNCHNGSCEFLIDCGGPCPPCPTCSDGIKNQGEFKTDCGGPCPPCPPEKPLIKDLGFSYILLIIDILLFALLAYLARKTYKLNKRIKKYENTEE